MPRQTIKIIIPRKNDELLFLGNDIKTKHIADGIASLLPSDIADAFIDVFDRAMIKHQEQKDLYLESEEKLEQRNLILGIDEAQDSRTPGTLIFYILSVRDFLLGLHIGQEKNMGRWGFIVNEPKGKITVVIPRKPAEITSLSKSIVVRHSEDGVDSLLPADMMTDFAAALALANTLLAENAELKRTAEAATQARNKLLGKARGQNKSTPNTVLNGIFAIRNILLGHFRGAEQRLGDWGFTVNMSGPGAPPSPPPPEE